MTEVLLTVQQVADRLQVSRSNVYALVETGKLVAHRVGIGRGTIRVAETDLTEFVTSCRREFEPAEPPPPTRRRKLRHIRL